MGFLPTDIVNMLAWFKSDVGVTLDEDDRVSQWNDQSGLKHHATQPTADNRPWFYLNQINGLPALNFPAAPPTTYLFTDAISTPAPISLCLFVKAQRVNEYPCFCDGLDYIGSLLVWNYEDGGGPGYSIYSGTTLTSGPAAYQNQWMRQIGVFDNTNSYIRTLKPDNTPYEASGNAGNKTSLAGKLLIGAGGWLGNYVMQGYLTELIMYGRHLTSEDIDNLMAYFYNRYFAAPTTTTTTSAPTTTTTTPAPTTTTTTPAPTTTTTTTPPLEEPLLFAKWLSSYG